MMKKSITILFFIVNSLTPAWSANAGFSASELTFNDGSGWKETTSNICGDSIRVLKAKGRVVLSNGIILDSSIGTVREFIDERLIGAIMPFANTQLPPGWLPCDGRIIRVTSTSNCEFQVLANRIRTTWGPTSNPGSMIGSKFVGRFQLPDLRGQFLRGANTGISTNPIAVVTSTMRTDREDLNNTTDYQRFREPSFSNTITLSVPAQNTQTVGSYQRSGIMEHSSGHNFSPANRFTNASNAPHNHQGPAENVTSGYTLYGGLNSNALNDYDSTGGGPETYTPIGGVATLDSELVSAPHQHTNQTPTLSTGAQGQYPNNVGVLFGIRY